MFVKDESTVLIAKYCIKSMDSRNIDAIARKASQENLGQWGALFSSLASRCPRPRAAFSIRLKIYIFRIGKGGKRRGGESGILRHKNVHFGEEDKMYEGAKKRGGAARTTSDRAVEMVVLKTQLALGAFQIEFI